MPPPRKPQQHRRPGVRAGSLAFVDHRAIAELLTPFVPEAGERDFVVRCLLDEGPAHHRGANFVLLRLLSLLLEGRPTPAEEARDVPMHLPPHLADQLDDEDEQLYPLRLPTLPLDRLAPPGSREQESMVAALLDGPPQHALANVAMVCLIDAILRQRGSAAAVSSAPANLTEAFGVCVGELGMFSAARLFVRELLREPDRDAVAEVVASIGASYAVFDAVASRALSSGALPEVDPGPVVAALAGVSRVVVVGLETDCLEAMLPRLRGVRVVIVPDLTLEADLGRVQANLGESAELSDVDTFQRWAGRGAALLTTVYGADGFRATVCQAWLRAHGPDVRARFRSIVGWNVLGPKMDVYPRWLGETDAHDFAPLVGPGAGVA